MRSCPQAACVQCAGARASSTRNAVVGVCKRTYCAGRALNGICAHPLGAILVSVHISYTLWNLSKGTCILRASSELEDPIRSSVHPKCPRTLCAHNMRGFCALEVLAHSLRTHPHTHPQYAKR